MVNFSVLPTLVLWIIVFPYFLCLANHTGGHYRRAGTPDNNPEITGRSVNENWSVASKDSVGNSKRRESSDRIATSQPALLNDSSITIEISDASSPNTTGSNNSSRVIGEVVYSHHSTTGGLTLMDMNGPLISLEGDDPATKSSHIRVKRGLNHFGQGITNDLKDDDPSDARIEPEDIRPNHEILLPSSSDLKDSDDSARENKDFGNKETSLTADLPLSKYGTWLQGSRLKDIAIDSSLERRKKRYAPSRDRKTRKGAGVRRRKGGKSKRDRKHKKKHKKVGKSSAPGAGKSHLVDDLQVEAHVEKRDSGDPKSEREITKREVPEKSAFPRHKRRIDDGKESNPSPDSGVKRHHDNPGLAANEKSNDETKRVSKREEFRHSGCGNEELRNYDDVYEPDPQPLDDIEPRPDSADGMRKKIAARSVRQIRELVEKLTGKVDEIESYLKSGNIEERKSGGEKAAGADEGTPNSVRNVDRADFKNATKETEARVCADETEASKSKSDVKTSRRGERGEQKEKIPEDSTKIKKSTRILKRREASKKNRKKRKPHRKWDRWTDWSSCSVTCGKGRQIRWRHCTHDCTLAETEMEEKSCQLPACKPGKFLGIF